MTALAGEIRHAARALARAPGFTSVALVTIALGIGSCVTVFSVVERVLLAPLPFEEPHRLVSVAWQDEAGARQPLAPEDFATLRGATRQLVGASAYVAGGDVTFSVAGGDGAGRVPGAAVSANLFSLLGVRPLAGTGFAPGDDEPGAAPAVVLSERLWRRVYGADPRLIGEGVRLSGRWYTLRGVVADGDGFPAGAELWIAGPLRVAEALNTSLPVSFRVHVVGRLAAGATPATLNEELEALSPGLASAGSGEGSERTGLRAVPLPAQLVRGVRPLLLTLLAAVGLVLAMGCVNVANLVQLRALGRKAEIALGLTLGASRWAAARRQLLEAALLAAAGGGSGLGLGALGVRGVLALGPPGLPRAFHLGVDGRLVLFALALTAGVVTAVGALPALRAARVDPIHLLRAGTATAEVGRRRLQRLVVVTQVALALALVSGAGLAIGAIRGLLARDLGVQPERALLAKVTLGAWRYPDAPAQRLFFDQAIASLGRLSGVEAVGGADAVPLVGGGFDAVVVLGPDAPFSGPATARCIAVAGDYFQAIGLPLVAGRLFDSEAEGGPPTAIVDEVFARRYFAGADPLGRSISVQGLAREVIGMVGAVRHEGPTAPADPQIYVPFRQAPFPWPFLYLVIRTADRSPGQISAVRSTVRALDAEEPLDWVVPLARFYDAAVARQRFAAQVLTAFAAAALLLAGLGVYGVVAYSIDRDTRELAIRRALGATPVELARTVGSRVVGIAAVGLALGAALALALGNALATALPGVEGRDGGALVAGVALLVAVVAAATLAAIARIGRLSPLAALKAD